MRPAAAVLERAPVVSSHSRRVLMELRRAEDGALLLGELSGSPHDLGPLLRELHAAGLIKLVGTDGTSSHPDGVTLALRGARTRRHVERTVIARLAAGAATAAVTATAAHGDDGLPAEVEVAIVGAGFGGLGMAIRLQRAGLPAFVVLERAADVGGTWQANTYPGCQCDVPSNIYSFSFAPKHDWTHAYPEQPQIQAYLRDCARRFGILDRTRLGCEVLAASWVARESRWRLDTSHGSLSARVVVAAPGLLSEPSVPLVPGLDRFAGTLFHTAAWDHGHDLAGERVALIGTGATAIQVGPPIRPLVARLHVFQRTPPWILPHPDRAIGPRLQRAYRTVPGLQRLARLGVYALREGLVPGMTRDPTWRRCYCVEGAVRITIMRSLAALPRGDFGRHPTCRELVAAVVAQYDTVRGDNAVPLATEEELR
jgi:Pyridine nucleotide-disulphide oxidoreductase